MLPEDNKQVDFNPELIKVETIDEAKKKIFDLHNDLKKDKTQFSEKELSYQQQIDEMKSQLAAIENEKTEAQKKQEEEQKSKLEGSGAYKELYQKLDAEIKEIKEALKSKDAKLSEYEKKVKEIETLKEKQRTELLNKIPEAERGDFKDATIEMLTKITKFYEKDFKAESQNQLPSGQVPEKQDYKFKSEQINESPLDFFKKNISGKYK